MAAVSLFVVGAVGVVCNSVHSNPDEYLDFQGRRRVPESPTAPWGQEPREPRLSAPFYDGYYNT